jgi:hypothetical protein
MARSNWTYTKRTKHGQNPRIFEGTVHVCAHQVPFYYRLPSRVKISKDERLLMTEAAEERAKSQITDVAGELNYQPERLQATGWWRINNG